MRATSAARALLLGGGESAGRTDSGDGLPAQRRLRAVLAAALVLLGTEGGYRAAVAAQGARPSASRIAPLRRALRAARAAVWAAAVVLAMQWLRCRAFALADAAAAAPDWLLWMALQPAARLRGGDTAATAQAAPLRGQGATPSTGDSAAEGSGALAPRSESERALARGVFELGTANAATFLPPEGRAEDSTELDGPVV